MKCFSLDFVAAAIRVPDDVEDIFDLPTQTLTQQAKNLNPFNCVLDSGSLFTFQTRL